MSINPETEFPGKITPSSPQYPYGEARNITVPGDGTGTPFVAALLNDIFGFQQALLSAGVVVPSGSPDEVGASQYLQALQRIALLEWDTATSYRVDDTVRGSDGNPYLCRTAQSGNDPIADDGTNWIVGNIFSGLATLEQFGATAESGVPVTDSTAAIASAITAGKFDRNLITDRGENSFLASIVDLTDYNVGRFRMSGKDNTFFYADSAIVSGAFLDVGYDVAPTVHPSNIQHGDVGGFTLRTNGNVINYGASFDHYRRGLVSDIRVDGNELADELENAFKFNYSWNSRWENLVAQDHYGYGFEFSTLALNAATFTNLSAASERPTATNFFFDGGNTVVLISPSSEGGVLKGFDFDNDIRSVTIINPHTEGDNGAFFKSGTDNNGMSINIIGGASFNAENALNFTGNFEHLTITGFAMYDLDDLANLVINLSARNNVINNLIVVDSAKNVATDKQIRDSIVLSPNVDSCVINGIDIAKLYRREEFNAVIGSNITGSTHDGGNDEATVMTDSLASFVATALVGRTISNTTDGSSGVIIANTTTTITVAALTGGTDNDWDTGDAYTIPTPVDLTSNYVDTMYRRVCEITAAQRTSSALIGHIRENVTVTENDSINNDVITARNGTTGLVIGFNTLSKMLTIDGNVAGNCKVMMEHFRP